ncbi:MAG: hypothetical protein HY308_11905 [Gammaproteobacteria bacterium]|nr:hypothetical protein [Gammaproteobacteria bacterium]
MPTFTDYAVEKMDDLYLNHDNEVGSQLKLSDPKSYEKYKSTDCITYVLNVIGYAFEKMGNAEAARRAWALGKYGNKLAAYLVNQHHWKGIYINPDVNHPRDANTEHTFSALTTERSCQYYGVPISYKVANYRPTAKDEPGFQKVNPKREETTLNEVDISALRLVRFGFGISRGGTHTWLYSKGDVYEVHWAGIGPNLYEKSSLAGYPWLSGTIVVPPDHGALLRTVAALKCG